MSDIKQVTVVLTSSLAARGMAHLYYTKLLAWRQRKPASSHLCALAHHTKKGGVFNPAFLLRASQGMHARWLRYLK